MRRHILWALASVAASTIASAQTPPPPAPPARVFALLLNQIDKDVYSASGPSTSTNSTDGIVIGKTSVLLFDTKNTLADQQALNAEIARITSKPIKTVVLSHSDGDHINGLPTLPPGVQIYAQNYAIDTMRKEATSTGRDAIPPSSVPQHGFGTSEKLTIDGVRIELYHWAPGHTGGDTILYLPDHKIVFMGDMLITEIAEPFLHMENGGSPVGILKNLEGMAALDAHLYVSGHGPMITKAELLRRIAIYRTKIDRVRAMAAQGKSLAEVKAALGEAPPMPPVAGRPSFDFTTSIYTEAKR